MASQLNYKRTTTDKLSVKGVLSSDGSTITYMNEDKIEKNVKVSDLLSAFCDCPIDLSVSLKSEEDLELHAED